MTKTKPLAFLVLAIVLIYSCREDLKEEKYKRPDWLTGKVYSLIKEQPELSTFTKCVELTGYDKIIDVSGSYTVFAPSNDAFSLYFQNNSKYKSVDDIPISELTRLVKYHIVQNPWLKSQLRSLDVFGWIDTLDANNNKPKGYKRETLLLDKNQVYGVKMQEDKSLVLVDSLSSSWRRRIITDSRKYVPIFFKEYFDIYDLSSNDYEFYFQRPIDNSDDIYYANAKIVSDEIFAENGFVYTIDRVVEPMKNAFQILEDKEQDHSYSSFLALANTFPVLKYNEEETNDQPGADQGLNVDSLFDLTYPELTFSIASEKTKAPAGTYGLPSNVSIRYHHGIVAPTDEALDELISEYIATPSGWGTLNGAPEHIRRMIVNSHMSINPIYPTDFSKGYYNGESDIVKLDQSTIVEKQYSSNCTFIGVNKAIVPRAFLGVTGPVYLQRGFGTTMYAIEQSGLLSALKRQEQNYQFFIEPDDNLRLDSSLVYTYYSRDDRYSFFAFLISGATFQRVNFSIDDIRVLLLNHIGVEQPKKIARKEFIKNLAGNYLVFDNITGEVRGTDQTTKGYNGSLPMPNYPIKISTNADNGTTYKIENWFSFSASNLYTQISTNYPRFHNLLIKAGLALTKEYRYSFISENEDYTVFVPSDAALNNSNADQLSLEELKKFLMMHFIQGDLIFTDGNKSAGYYETTRIDEKSTPYSTVYTKIYISPGYDVINFPGKNGGTYLSVPESAWTNVITSRDLGEGDEPIKNIISNGVIHEIDKVLLYSEVETQ